MTLSDSRSGRRLSRRRGRYPRQNGPPPLPASPFHRAVPITPADQMGARVDCFPICAAFPVSLAGRHPHLHFRGLLRLYPHYGPLDCSTAQGDLCHEASVTSYPATLLVSYQTYRQLSGWILPPLVIHALRGTQRYAGV